MPASPEPAPAPSAAPGEDRPGAPQQGGRPPRATRWLVAFSRFWWEFLIGDTPELFVGMLVVLGVAAGLAGTGVAGWVVVPLVVISLLVASVARGARAA